MDELGAPALIIAAVTILSPILTSVFTQVNWSSNAKRGVAFGVSVVIAAVYLITSGEVTNWADIPLAVSAVYGLQQITYSLLMAKTNLGTKIEMATPIGASAKAAVAQINETVENVDVTPEVVVLPVEVPVVIDDENKPGKHVAE